MVIESPVFKKYVNWQDRTKFSGAGIYNLRSELLEILPYEIVLPETNHIDLRDIDDFVQDEWSAYASALNKSHYFFKLEEDAVAFKLRWL